MAEYVADAVRLRLVKDRALAQVTELFGGPPPEDVLATVRQRAGLPPQHLASSSEAAPSSGIALHLWLSDEQRCREQEK